MLASDMLDTKSGPCVVQVAVRKVNGEMVSPQIDALAVEEPLEIRLGFEHEGKRTHKPISVTMRTPGHDKELAVGFLQTEGIISSVAQIEHIRHCGSITADRRSNVIRVDLCNGVAVNLQRLERHFYTSSSCGICGKTSLEAVKLNQPIVLPEGIPFIESSVVHRLPSALRAAQSVFDRTGGLHGAGLFDAAGELLCLYEDVGRHNAVDKLIGSQFLAGKLPLADRIIFLSGRASFELVQKAMMGGIAVVAAVGAPSSLAVDLARDCGMTILGFVRDGRFTIYSGESRIRKADKLMKV